MEFDIFNLEEMQKFGLKLARNLLSGIVVALLGDLGAGKTTLVRSVAKGLGISEVVQSPTFNIMKLYLKGDRPLIHIDAYRLADLNNDIGLDEYIEGNGVTFIEWPKFIEPLIPSRHLEVSLKRISDSEREIEIFSETGSYESIFNALEEN